MNILNDIFRQSMSREHKTVTVCETGEQFECFFRKNNDNINYRDTMIMFYDVDSPVEVGTLLLYGGNIYLTLNKETAENDVYFKSAVIRTNGEKCSICSGARVIAGINDLATLEPLLVKQWSRKNKIKPIEVSIGSQKKVIWRCKKGHEWEATVKSRTIKLIKLRTYCRRCVLNLM